MNSLSYFWNNGSEEQKDILEGMILSTSPQNFSDILPNEFMDIQLTDICFRAVGYAYCHVLCMARIEFKPIMKTQSGTLVDISTPPDMEALGEYAIIINNEAELLRRINQAAGNNKYLCGPVNYHPPMLNGERMEKRHHIVLKSDKTFDIGKIPGNHLRLDAFDKSERYRGQNEWRLCLYDGKKSEKAIDLDIGDLHDISHVVKTRNLESELRKLSKNISRYQQDLYYGNANRRELRELLYKLGDNQAWAFSTIG